MADSVEVSTIETTDGTIGVIRDNAARQSIANLREGKETVGSVAWENVKGRPTKVSELENDKKYQTDENVSNTLNSTLYAGSSTHGGPATSADKLTTARTISLGGAAAGSGSFDGSANSTINVSSLDATKLTGVVPITNLPPSVVERMSVVKDDTERFALTKDKVQDGDVVKVQSSGLMYYVVDDDKLNAEAGYEVFKAGTAASVPWGGVTGKPSSYPPSSHTHTKSQITDFPSSLPNPSNLTMQIEGKNAAVYNGSASQTFNVTKSSLGLDKVNNTADADKSVKYAASTPWIGVTGKPSTFPPSAHTHTKSQITDLGVFGGASATAAGSAGLVPQPAAGDQDRYLSAKGTWESITGKISGTKVTAADTADSIKTYTRRPASANKLFGDGKLRYFLATERMTEGKPPAGDAAVLDLAWDNDGGWDAQIAIPTPNGPLQIRRMRSGTWQPWVTVYDENNKPSPSEIGAQPSGYYTTASLIGASTPDCTVDDIFKLRKGTTGGVGSVNIKQKSSGLGSEVPAGWYNYIYSPHRTGIGGDNDRYATVILCPMNFSGESYILRYNNGLEGVTNLNSPNFLSANDKSKTVATVPYYTYDQLNSEFGTSGSNIETYLQNWVKKIMKSHSNLSGIVIVGTANPNAQGTIIFRAYDLGNYNNTGFPQYCEGQYFGLNSGYFAFGTYNGVWKSQSFVLSNALGAVSNTINTHIANKSNPHGVTKAQVGLGNVANLDQSKAIKSITRSGTTFTATALDGTTTTFTQQDNNTTYGLASQSSNGLMSAADKKAVDREFFRMLPKGGTYIPANADLNTIEYIKIGSYYSPSNRESTTMKNIPIGTAFIMYVLAPLSKVYDNESTDKWVYRLRIFITSDGRIFVQAVNSDTTAGSFTYGPWVKMINSNDLGAVSNKVAKYTLTASNWSGTSAPYTYDLGSTYGNNSVIGFDSAVGNATQLEAAMSANIQGSSTTKIYAYGDKPTVDIPIVINYQ